jgi:hypothetical protein
MVMQGLRATDQQHQHNKEVFEVLAFHVVALAGVDYTEHEDKCAEGLSHTVEDYV